jgi:hypothetical protein
VRTLTAGFLAQLGAAADDPIVRLQVARADELTMLADPARAKAIRGEAVDLDHLIRLERMCTRAVRALHLPAARRESNQPILQTYLAQHYGERAEKPADAFEAGPLPPRLGKRDGGRPRRTANGMLRGVG